MDCKVTAPKLVIALDFPDTRLALDFLDMLEPELCRVKIGKELFTRAGPELVRQIIHRGFDVFLDLKFHDIPATVANACSAAADLGVWMLNVHALGGEKMLLAARESLHRNDHNTLLVAVTILTSMETQDLQKVGMHLPVDQEVLLLAELAKTCGLDGVVCSAREVEPVSRTCGRDFILVTPGIRPQGGQQDDQKRVMTPAQAVQAGSHYLVIGRPVSRAENPRRVLQQLNDEIRIAAGASNPG